MFTFIFCVVEFFVIYDDNLLLKLPHVIKVVNNLNYLYLVSIKILSKERLTLINCNDCKL